MKTDMVLLMERKKRVDFTKNRKKIEVVIMYGALFNMCLE